MFYKRHLRMIHLFCPSVGLCFSSKQLINSMVCGMFFFNMYTILQYISFFRAEEDRKNAERMRDLVDKLQSQIRTYKKQIEEAEEIATINLTKFRFPTHHLII